MQILTFAALYLRLQVLDGPEVGVKLDAEPKIAAGGGESETSENFLLALDIVKDSLVQ